MIRALLASILPLLALLHSATAQIATLTPAATGFPTPSFTNSNLTSWVATSSAYCQKDSFNSVTWTACEDMSATGNGLCQDQKSAQPAVSNGGFYFTQNGQYMVVPCFLAGLSIADLFTGTQFTVGVTFEIDSVLGSANQIIFDYVAGGNAHKAEIYVNTAGNIAAVASTGGASTVTGGAVSTGSKHTAIIAGDLNTCAMTLYFDGVSQGTSSCTVTTFGSFQEVDLGNSSLPTATPYQLPLNGYITCFTAQAANQSGAAITSLQNYHSGGSC